MSISTLLWAVEQDDGIDPIPKLVLIALAKHTGTDDTCWPSATTLAKAARCSERAARAAIAELKLGGWITIQHRAPKSSLYTLRVDRLAEDDNRPQKTSKQADASLAYVPTLQTVQGQNPANCAGSEATEPCTPCMVTLHSLQGDPAQFAGNLSNELRKEEVPLLRNGDSAAPPPALTEPVDPRAQLWQEGRTILRRLTGQLNGQAGKQIGAFLKAAGGDCPTVLDAMRSAVREEPHEPIPWIFAGIKHRLRPEPTYRMPANQIGDAYGLHDREHREAFAAGLTEDFSGFLNGSA